MGATSATGVGPGSVEGVNQGSKHWTVGANRVIGPRVVVAGRTTLDNSGDATEVLPKLDGNATDYVVVGNSTTVSAAAAVGMSLTNNTNDTTVTLKGTANHVVQWAIIKVGMAL